MSTVPRLRARPSPAWVRWLPLLAWVGFIVGVFRPGAVGFVWVGKQPWGDKLAHVLLIGTLAFLLDHALAGRRVRGVPLAVLLTVLFMTAEEVSQIWLPGRSFELIDLAANYLGIAAAGLLSVWLSRRGEPGIRP